MHIPSLGVFLASLLLVHSESTNVGSLRRRVAQEDLQEYYDFMEEIGFNATYNIAGGGDASNYPWFVHFASKVCAGTLISPNRVLTSATCLQYTGVPSLVRVGATNAYNGVLSEVACAKTHPDYFMGNGTSLADLAVLKLVSAIDHITPVILNTDSSYPSEEGQSLTAMGMGSERIGGRMAAWLQEVDLDFVSMDECQVQYQSDLIVQRGKHLCGQGKSRGLCSGDSGGPLIDRNSVQVGIASFSYGECGSKTIPDVFTPVASYIDWIYVQLDDNTCDGNQTPVPTTAAPTTSQAPTTIPTTSPSGFPTGSPTVSQIPSQAPTLSQAPSLSSSPSMSSRPSMVPSASRSPTNAPTNQPTTVAPEPPTTDSPTSTMAPTVGPTLSPKEEWVEFLSPILGDLLEGTLNDVQGVLDFDGSVIEEKRQWFRDHFSNKRGGLFGRQNGDD